MIAGAVALARGAWSAAGRAMKGFGNWLRKERPPGWWWRAAAAVLGVVCLGFAFVAMDAKREVLVVTERCNAQVATIESRARSATEAADTNRRALNTCRIQLEAEVGKRQQVERLAQAAVAAAEAQEAQAQAELTEWQRSYRRRPATCEAALQALETQCSTITDY